ncbi:hypothetical protein [Meiothermus taiwanensis]|jgi:predicted nucleic acid-binding protein|uniref:PIN domain-containing protein n=1 Tax=Meiothermus taiwanensis TaxID=172827 RepID=A0A399DYN2_9DEIN|nr:hypothetical protein [Meiothermus taiwanensis]RIH76976.1 hypothetical protein Mcate_01524 [Meiothermus taiwanensis]
MVLDSSVLIQLIFAEPGYRETLERILEAEVRPRWSRWVWC